MKTVKSTISFHLKFSIILLITIGFTGFTTTTANTMDFIPGISEVKIKSIIDIGCSALVGASTIQPCSEEFKNTVEQYRAKPTSEIDINGNYYHQENQKLEMPVWTYCCAVTTLRYCVIDKIGQACGDDAEKTANSLVSGVVAAVKLIDGKQPCDGNEYYYRKESPICWDFWGPLTGIAIMAIMFITTCCCCCIWCCRRCCRRQRRTIVQIVHQPPTTVDYTPLKEMI